MLVDGGKVRVTLLKVEDATGDLARPSEKDTLLVTVPLKGVADFRDCEVWRRTASQESSVEAQREKTPEERRLWPRSKVEAMDLSVEGDRSSLMELSLSVSSLLVSVPVARISLME